MNGKTGGLKTADHPGPESGRFLRAINWHWIGDESTLVFKTAKFDEK
jgi:hypothetical protein